jgi:hypothetical protein
MWYIWGREEVCTGFCWGNLKERDHFEDLDEDGRIISYIICFSFRRSVQDYNIQMDMEIITFLEVKE